MDVSLQIPRKASTHSFISSISRQSKLHSSVKAVPMNSGNFRRRHSINTPGGMSESVLPHAYQFLTNRQTHSRWGMKTFQLNLFDLYYRGVWVMCSEINSGWKTNREQILFSSPQFSTPTHKLTIFVVFFPSWTCVWVVLRNRKLSDWKTEIKKKLSSLDSRK